ncbi:MAG: phage tail sheath C-terminal domain-containing protein [Bacteroidota bacterium]
MTNFKTPGVYIQEISKLPASVAPVATAIPAFVGYTAKNEKDGKTIPVNTPTRITSLLEFEEFFGGPFDEKLTVTLTGASTSETDTEIDVNATGEVSPHTLYYHLQMFFGNGGGPCYIVSVGNFATDPVAADIDVAELQAGVAALEKEDEVTLLVVPEAVTLSVANRRVINDDILAQCTKLQDRFAMMDAKVLGGTTAADASGFRGDVSSDNLKYGAAYYPDLITTLQISTSDASVAIDDNRTGGTFDALTIAAIANGTNVPVAATGTITVTTHTNLDGDTITVNGQAFTGTAADDTGTNFSVAAGAASTAENILQALNRHADGDYSASRTGAVITIVATTAGAAGNSIDLSYTDGGSGVGASVSGATLTGGSDGLAPDKTLYNNIIAAINQKFKVILPPAATMTGVFARVDSQRGVWKAPANVGVRLVREPSVLVTNEEQELFNIDATSGKSINVIRSFQGRGVIVWGARTLAGNDNEWRYVPVRRLYIFLEESIKKATEFVVFEPNDANTWLRMKTMIENFLTQQWRDGALAGAVPEDAFFVKVGLGETMTAVDILEGRMNVEIGLAAVRPAEFIILKFSHKLQES